MKSLLRDARTKSFDLVLDGTQLMTGGRLLWTRSTSQLEREAQAVFYLNPALGLTDVNSHQVNTGNWPAMQSPGPQAVAFLIVTPNSKVADLQHAVQEIASLGGYETVQIAFGTL